LGVGPILGLSPSSIALKRSGDLLITEVITLSSEWQYFEFFSFIKIKKI